MNPAQSAGTAISVTATDTANNVSAVTTATIGNDTDSDNDGISDLAEGYNSSAPSNSTDSDNDGVPDYLESNTADQDGDGTTDHLDADNDTDGDGESNAYETANGSDPTDASSTSGSVTPPAAPTPPARNAWDVVSFYSDTYTNSSPPNWDGGSDISISGNTTRLLSNYTLGTLNFASANVSAMTTLHLDIFSVNQNPTWIRINGQQQFVATTPVNGWTSLDIPLSSFTGANLSAVTSIVIFNPTGAEVPLKTAYVDNVYFFKESTTYTTSWSNSAPTATIDAIIDGDLTTTADLVCKDLTINLGKTLTIAAGTTLTVSGNLVNNGSIIFKSDVTGSGQFDEFTGSITGNGTVQVERFIPARRAFRFLTSSVTTLGSIFENWQENSGEAGGLGTHITGTGGATNGFDVTATNNPSMFDFNHNTGQWAAVTNTNVNTLTAGTPYRLMVRGDRTTDLTTNTPASSVTTLRATGSLKTGDFTPALNQAAEGFSFIGNPYQAPLDMEAVLTNNATNMNTDVLYYWDPTINTRGGYVTRTLSANSNNVNSDFTEILQPGQAVFVKKDNTATAATMTISETHKNVAAGAAGVFRTSASNTQSNAIGLLRANLQATIDNQWQTTDAALTLFATSYTWDVTQEDATKINNLDEEVSFVQNNTSLAIAKQNDASETDELPIRLQQLRHTNYRWVFDLTNYSGNTPYLLDTEQNTLSVIENGTVFPFTAGSNATNRFKIVFQNTTLTTDDFVKNIKLYPNPAKAGASFFVAGITEATVSVYNVVGQNIPVTVMSQGNAVQVTPTAALSQGVYLVTVTTAGKTTQIKWIVE